MEKKKCLKPPTSYPLDGVKDELIINKKSSQIDEINQICTCCAQDARSAVAPQVCPITKPCWLTGQTGQNCCICKIIAIQCTNIVVYKPIQCVKTNVYVYV